MITDNNGRRCMLARAVSFHELGGCCPAAARPSLRIQCWLLLAAAAGCWLLAAAELDRLQRAGWSGGETGTGVAGWRLARPAEQSRTLRNGTNEYGWIGFGGAELSLAGSVLARLSQAAVIQTRVNWAESEP